MDILEPRQPSEYEDQIINIFKKLRFYNVPLEFKGSSALKSQKYPSDIDLFSAVSENKWGASETLAEINRIRNSLDDPPRTFIIETKIQFKNGSKIRYFDKSEITATDFIRDFDKIDFIKIDAIIFINNRFSELSVIYRFNTTTPTKEDYIRDLNTEIKELKREGRWFKVLKRLFSLFKIQGKELHINQLLYLTEIFNSDLGKLYQTISNLEAIKLALKYYPELTQKQVKLNLKELGFKSNVNLDATIAKLSRKLNAAAKSIFLEDFS